MGLGPVCKAIREFRKARIVILAGTTSSSDTWSIVLTTTPTTPTYQQGGHGAAPDIGPHLSVWASHRRDRRRPQKGQDDRIVPEFQWGLCSYERSVAPLGHVSITATPFVHLERVLAISSPRAYLRPNHV